MSIATRRWDRGLLALALAVFTLSAIAGAAIGAPRLGLIVPAARPGSPGDAGAILANNLEIWMLLLALTLLQPRGVAGLVPGPLPLWLTDATVALVVAANVAALGGVLGALGLHALVRVIPHAPPELGGYLLGLTAYLRARLGELAWREAALRFAAAAGLLICAAVIESYVSGALP